MALLQASKNSLIGNVSFTDKAKVYKESTFLLTKEIANQSEWSPDLINERQQRLADLAVKTWPIL